MQAPNSPAPFQGREAADAVGCDIRFPQEESVEKYAEFLSGDCNEEPWPRIDLAAGLFEAQRFLLRVVAGFAPLPRGPVWTTPLCQGSVLGVFLHDS